MACPFDLESDKIYSRHFRFYHSEIIYSLAYRENIFDDGTYACVFLSRVFDYDMVDTSVYHFHSGRDDYVPAHGNAILYFADFYSYTDRNIMGRATVIKGHLNYL